VACEGVQPGAFAEQVQRPGQLARIPAAVTRRRTGAVSGPRGMAGDDIDDTRTGAITVLDRAAAAKNLDALDRIQWDGGPLHAGLVDVVQAPAIDQDERVLRGRRTESAHVERRERPVVAE